ncbi:MAG TPA: tetratricopeptide repeat protein [Negativicutes bacterium]|nr:tetratricopeptide repeat protein [Negativicutes bacterium]
MNSLERLRAAGVVTPDNRIKSGLSPDEFRLIETMFKEASADKNLYIAYLAAVDQKGFSLHRQGNYAEAVGWRRKAVAMDPNSPELLYALGHSLKACAKSMKHLRYG